MEGKRDKKGSPLRQRAELKWAALKKGRPAVSGADHIAVVHELQVHQIELEMQNEELRRAQQEAEELRDKYQDLYDFAGGLRHPRRQRDGPGGESGRHRPLGLRAAPFYRTDPVHVHRTGVAGRV